MNATIKNNIDTNLYIGKGIVIPSSSQINIDDPELARDISFEFKFNEYLENGDLTVNNGSIDLLKVDAIRYMRGNTASILEVSFGSGVISYSTSYKSLAKILYQGSNVIGKPTNIKIYCRWGYGNAFTVRVVNISTIFKYAIICEKSFSGFTSMPPEPQDMGIISNIPTSDSIFELQAKRISGSGILTIYCLGMRWIYDS